MRLSTAVGTLAALALHAASAPARAQTADPDANANADAASDEDQVLLKDGSVLTGEVVTQEPGRFVVVRTASGEQTIGWDEIRRVTISPAHAAARTSRRAPTRAPEPSPDPAPPVAATPSPIVSWANRPASVSSSLYALGTWFFKSYKGQYSNGSKWAGGGGGGVGLSFSLLFGSHPDSARGSSNWTAFELGSAVDVAAVYFYNSLSVSPSVKKTMVMLQWPLIIGGRFGLGSFKSESSWSGAALGFAWTPQWTWFSNERAHADSGGAALLSGQVSLDIGSMDALAVGREGVFRFFFRHTYGTGEMPHTATIGLGFSRL